MWHVWGQEKECTGIWWGNLRKGDHLENPGVEERKILKRIVRKWDGAWTVLNRLRIGTGGELL
jgi:hypothetical protein